MTTSPKKPAARQDVLRKMLEDRQAELRGEVKTRIGELRTTAGLLEVHDMDEDSSNDVQQDIDLAMIQMRAETSRLIEAALARLEAGEYGDCASCGKPIPAKRLQALPFAIRCVACAGAREDDTSRARKQARDREMPPNFVTGERTTL